MNELFSKAGRGGKKESAEAADVVANFSISSSGDGQKQRAQGVVTAGQSGGGGIRSGKRIATLTWFTRQLFVLVTSGMPIAQALETLQRQAGDDDWRKILGDVRSGVEEGLSLGEAMATCPTHFDAVYRSLITAGETGGQLKIMLRRLAALMEQQLRTRRAITGALIYPALLICIAGGALIAMLVVVLPRFAGLFETLDVPLPPTTQVLMFASDTVRGYWWVLLILIVGGGVSAFFGLRSTGGKRAMDGFVLRLPQLGPIIRNFATERIARLLGVLLMSNVTALEALGLVREAMSNVHYAELLSSAEEAVGRGEPISSALADPSLINPSVYEAVRSGEQTGQMGSLLQDIAEFLDEENCTSIRSLTAILEPFILVVLGVVIGFIAISLFLPLFDLTAAT